MDMSVNFAGCLYITAWQLFWRKLLYFDYLIANPIYFDVKA